MKVIIAGGGSGGHLYPAIAVARELLRRSGTAVLFVGTREGIENRVLPGEGLPLRLIGAGKLRGMKPRVAAETLQHLPQALLQSISLLREARPDCVIGFGGYASGPVGLASALLGIPLLVVETNAGAGLANKALGLVATRVLLCFPGTVARTSFPAHKVAYLGPLVRRGIDRGELGVALTAFGLHPGLFTVLVMGGSGGSPAIDRVIEAALEHLKSAGGIQFLHQVGRGDATKMKTAYQRAELHATVLPYLNDMPGAYRVADLVVCRSGAGTVAELAVCGKPSILIPFPAATDDHQARNARALERLGSATVLLQRDFEPARLAALIKETARRGSNGRPIPLPDDAAGEVARICREVARERRSVRR